MNKNIQNKNNITYCPFINIIFFTSNLLCVQKYTDR